jgi:hypothetical protein
MTERLTTLAAVKEYLGITTDESDAGLTRLINAASQFILNYLSRDSFQRRSYTENFYGNGKTTTLLRNWPILSVSSVGIGGRLVLPSVLGVAGLPGTGYTISDPRPAPQSINLYGYGFVYRAPSQIIYEAGFETTDTSVLVAADPPADPVTYAPQSGGVWSSDLGVTLDGVVAVLVTGAPSAGEYAVDEWGTYSFSADVVGKVAVISYSYTPWDVSFAAVEMIAEWYRRADRIGMLSKTLGGQETIAFSQKDFNDTIRRNLQNYVNVVSV